MNFINAHLLSLILFLPALVALVIFFLLLFFVLEQRYPRPAIFASIPLAMMDPSFLLLFLALAVLGFYRREVFIGAVGVLGMTLNYYLYGFETGGGPKGHFLDIFSVYAAIFSPLVFLYFIYTMYWFLIKWKKPFPMLWFTSFTVFVFSLLLSLRQNIDMADFGPYAVIAVPLVVYLFLHSMRLRLPQFRRRHQVIFLVVMISLATITGLTFYNKPFYLLISNPKKHFAFEHHFAKELAEELKSRGIRRVVCADASLQVRLRFYGIGVGGKKLLLQGGEGKEFIAFSVWGKEVVRYTLLPLRSL